MERRTLMSDKKQCRPCNDKAQPKDCSPEMIKDCHGNAQDHPCETDGQCAKPDRLKCVARKCSPEQSRECHGED
jgi:hypothetical protein